MDDATHGCQPQAKGALDRAMGKLGLSFAPGRPVCGIELSFRARLPEKGYLASAAMPPGTAFRARLELTGGDVTRAACNKNNIAFAGMCRLKSTKL